MTSAEDESISVVGGKHNVTCQYDTVFGEDSTQEDVFEFVKPSILQVVQGYNCTIFAYGQTGTGKTYTMLGKEREDRSRDVNLEHSDECGVIPRAVDALFEEIRANAEHGTAAALHVAYMQIYNDNIYDLMSDPRHVSPLPVREAIKGNSIGVFVSGLSEVPVLTCEVLMKFIPGIPGLASISGARREHRRCDFRAAERRSQPQYPLHRNERAQQSLACDSADFHRGRVPRQRRRHNYSTS